MRSEDLLKLLDDDNRFEKPVFFSSSIKEMLLQNLWRLMRTSSDAVNVATHQLKQPPAEGIVRGAFKNSTTGMSYANDIFFDLTTTITLPDHKQGFALRLRGPHRDLEVPTLFVCVDDQNKIYASIFDATEKNSTYEDLDFQEIPMDKIEKAVMTWIKGHVSPECVDLMKRDAFSNDLQNLRGRRNTLNSLNFHEEDSARWLQHFTAMAHELNHMVTAEEDGPVSQRLMEIGHAALQQRIQFDKSKDEHRPAP